MTATTLDDVCARIVLLGKEITGITATADPAPYNIDTADMPMLVVFAGQSMDDDAAGGNEFSVETRIFRIVVAVMPHGQGATLEAEQVARDLIPAVKSFFRARQNFENLDYVMSARVVGDSAIVRLQEYDGKYVGFTVNLEVSLYIEKDYVDY